VDGNRIVHAGLHTSLGQRGAITELLEPGPVLHPAEAAALLDALAAQHPGAALVGSSLGGYYATWLAEKYGVRAVLVNPGVTPHVGLRAYLGPQQNLYTGAKYMLTQQHLDELAALETLQPTRMARYYLMVTTGDEVIDYRAAVAKYAGARQLVVQGSDHGFADFRDHLDSVLAFAGIA